MLLPVFVTAWTASRSPSASVELLDDEDVRRFVGTYRVPFPLLGTSEVTSQGPFAMPDYYFVLQAAAGGRDVRRGGGAGRPRGRNRGFTGRRYEPLERYRLADLAQAIVLMGSSAGTAKDVVDESRDRHWPVGLLRIGAFRPFRRAVREALDGVPDIAVLDRADSPEVAAAPAEIAAAVHSSRAQVRSVVYGLGGREAPPEDIEGIFDSLHVRADGGPTYVQVEE